MAPEIALNVCEKLPSSAVVLDPMAGSGMVLRAAAEYSLRGIGVDIDPLAVLLSKVWTKPIDLIQLKKVAEDCIEHAQALNASDIVLPWIDEHKETSDFVNFWFGRDQRNALRQLSFLLSEIDDCYGDALRVALSRLIITKERGASLAADVSYSRPHRVYSEENYEFDVFSEFKKSVNSLSKYLAPERLKGNIHVAEGDARFLDGVRDEEIDIIITSPPYLNAIDYLRGHRLSLVWFGYQIDKLRSVRSNSIGTERKPEPGANLGLASRLTESTRFEDLSRRNSQSLKRYALDISASICKFYRVLKPGGELILVIGNSTHNGIYVENTKIIIKAFKMIGFTWLKERTFEREILPARRYLPPPKNSLSTLKNRMWTETVVVLKK